MKPYVEDFIADKMKEYNKKISQGSFGNYKIVKKEENNNTLEKEILTLITHGILHLLGFDHQTKKEYDFVVGVQNKVLKNYEQISI